MVTSTWSTLTIHPGNLYTRVEFIATAPNAPICNVFSAWAWAEYSLARLDGGYRWPACVDAIARIYARGVQCGVGVVFNVQIVSGQV